MSRVFVLGSGFSAKAGAPLSRSVLSEIFHPERRNPQLEDLQSYLGNFLFQGRPDWIENTQLEEVLSRLDLIRHYKPYPGVDYKLVSHYEELLLAEFIKLLSPRNINCRHRSYRLFAEQLGPNDTVISFNYDLIMEELMQWVDLDYDYNLFNNTAAGDGRPIDLLKLHGSINQYYCEACGKIYLSPPEQLCRNCLEAGRRARLRHFIIAPTLFKSYSLPALRNLWFKALKSLAGAGRIYFIGYSLPAADILSYQLFDYARRLAPGPQKAFLIDGRNLNTEKFGQIYGGDLVNEGLYFEEWVAAGACSGSS